MAPIHGKVNVEEIITKTINNNKVAIFSKSTCPFCLKVKSIFKSERIVFEALELDLIENGDEIQASLQQTTGLTTVPNVFINGKFVGDSNKITTLLRDGQLPVVLNPRTHNYDYDFIVIGGGSGGLAASKEATRLGAKVAVCDFVKPTPIGTTWGLGGTCVNVGCIPKKLMHQAAIMGHELKDSADYGWKASEEKNKHDWVTMVENVQNHIGSLNWGYRVALRDKKVDYLNVYATFKDAHTIKVVDRKGKEKEITGDKFMIATGGRPSYPAIPGAKEFGITSDDIFSLQHPPGKTLLVGASYIALECAGFLAGLGYDVTVMVRSILLRGFDQQMANMIGNYMEKNGVKFIRSTVPKLLEKLEDGTPGLVRVTATGLEGEEVVGEYNTVMFAIGRNACTQEMNLQQIGVNTSQKNGKIIVNNDEQSSQSHIYGVGDVIDGGLELTPVAIQAGKLLARRLYGGSAVLTDYTNVPTTVFTPLEYGCCGISEEAAIATYGENDIEVYHSHFWPLEYTVPHRPENDCYAKLICVKSQQEKVVGFHYLGPNAGEVTQGFSIALKLGATKYHFDDLVGIHPTCAEVFTTMTITKNSGKDVTAQGC